MSNKEKLKIAIAVIDYQNLTGVEMYVYELARQLHKLGHEILITAPAVGGEIMERTIKLGVRVASFEDCPTDWSPDVLHINEFLPSAFALMLWPEVPVVATVHSEYPVERPFLTPRVHKYICVRPQVQEVLISQYGVPANRTEVIYNGVDFERFQPIRPEKAREKETKKVLFVGTIDPLRRLSIEHLINEAHSKSHAVRVIGKKVASYLDAPPAHVEVLPPTWSVENYMKDIDETAGVLLGRTTIEGWVAGKPGWIYDIDLEGKIRSVKLHEPPKNIDKFNILNVTQQILQQYHQAIRHRTALVTDAVRCEETRIVLSMLVARSVSHGMQLHNFAQSVNQLGPLAESNQKLHDKVVEMNESFISRDKKLIHKVYRKGRKIIKKLKT